MIPVVWKETARYLIIAAILWLSYLVTTEAILLAKLEKLDTPFSLVTSGVYGALTFVLKFVFETKVSKE